MVIIEFAGRSTDKDGKGGANALTTCVTNILHIGLHSGIEVSYLLKNDGFNLLDMRTNEIERKELRVDGFAIYGHRHPIGFTKY